MELAIREFLCRHPQINTININTDNGIVILFEFLFP